MQWVTWCINKRKMLQEIVIAWGSFIGKSRFSCHRAKWPMPARDKRWDSTGCHHFPNPWTLGYHHFHHVFCRWLPLPSTMDHYNTMFAFVDRFVFFWIHKKMIQKNPSEPDWESHPNDSTSSFTNNKWRCLRGWWLCAYKKSSQRPSRGYKETTANSGINMEIHYLYKLGPGSSYECGKINPRKKKT